MFLHTIEKVSSMPTKYSKKFKPERGYLFKAICKDKKYREKISNSTIKNRVKPYPNELFTSWISRNATINFLQTPTFINYYFPEYKNKLLNRDTDIMLDKKMSENFANRMLLKAEDIFQTSLQSYVGYLNETIVSNTRNPLISPVKIKGSYPKIKGLRYCPECLREKDYFRKEWRLSFYTICPKHRCFMLDKCPQCSEPILITKRKLNVESFNCWNCGHIFKNSDAEGLPKKSFTIKYLNNIMDILNKGFFKFEYRLFHSISYFIVLKHITKLIVLREFRNIPIYDRLCNDFDINVRNSSAMKSKFLEETMSLKELFVVYNTASHIMLSRKNMDLFIKTHKIQYSDLKRDMPYIPFWYESIIDNYRKYNYNISNSEIKSAYEWLLKNNIKPTYTNLGKLMGIYLDKRRIVLPMIK